MDAQGRVSPAGGAGVGSAVGSAEGRTGGPPQLGRYRLLRRIGEGGMGVVHLAAAPDGCRVALKVLRPHVVADTAGRQRLAREVDALQRVRSRRVAALLDADAWGDTPYVVTRFVPGLSLNEYVDEYGPLRGAGLLGLGRGLAEALAEVHAVGVVHRDVKPSNVLIENDEPVLIDFGLARAADDATVTVAGWMLGTPAYLTPEIVEGRDPEPPCDVHAWASTLAYACTGRSPFGGGHQTVVLDRVRRNDYDLSEVPADVRRVLERCLATDPRSRPSAAVLAGWLGAAEPARDPTTVHVPAAPVTPSPAPAPAPAPASAAAPATRPYVGPEPAPAWTPPRAAIGIRLLRALVIVLGVALCAATFAAAPYAAALGWWLVSSALFTWQRVLAARQRRRAARGRAGASDGVVAALSAPWHAVIAVLGAALLVGSALLAAAVVTGLLNLFGVALGQLLWIAAGVFLAVLWRGPGSARLHWPAVRVVDQVARPDLVGLALVWVLAAFATGSIAVVQGVDTFWWPDGSAPL